jgi:hypothetical protein
METLVYTEAGRTEERTMAVEKQLVDRNVKITTKLQADRKIKAAQPRSTRNTENGVRPNHLLRLL